MARVTLVQTLFLKGAPTQPQPEPVFDMDQISDHWLPLSPRHDLCLFKQYHLTAYRKELVLSFQSCRDDTDVQWFLLCAKWKEGLAVDPELQNDPQKPLLT
ncbi:hypothetical protein QQ045_002169 [Rhodiola kirilowii]